MKRSLPFAAGSPALIWQVLFFYVPLALMVVTSVIGTAGNFSFENFGPVLAGPFFRVIFRSLLLAVSTAVICAVVGRLPVHATV